MVVGPRGGGKTTLIKTLLNWRTREQTGKGKGEEGKIVFVNLDVGEGGMTLPGTLSITSISALLPTTSTVSSLGTSISSGPPVPFPSTSTSSMEYHPTPSIDAYAPPVNPLIFWHGHTSPNSNAPLYDVLLKRVGKSLKRKLAEGGLESWRAGCVVDTPGEWAEKKGMGSVIKAVRELESELLAFGLSFSTLLYYSLNGEKLLY